MFVVFDLDGTLADCRHRLHFIKPPAVENADSPFKADWDAFYRACHGDDPVKPVIGVLNAFLAFNHPVEIWSGRRSDVRVPTLSWLDRQALPNYETRKNLRALRMRPVGDHQEDYKLKESWLLAALAADQKPDLVFEDRQQCVDMFRGYGITVCQVAEGNF